MNLLKQLHQEIVKSDWTKYFEGGDPKVKESNKDKPCPLCKRTDFNYKQYGEFYCNNPEHLPRRIKKS